MRIRTEAVGGYDLSGLFLLVIGVLGLAALSLVMLIGAIICRAKDRPVGPLLRVGGLIALPLVIAILYAVI